MNRCYNYTKEVTRDNMVQDISTTTVLKNIAYIPAIFLGISTDSIVVLIILMSLDTFLGVLRVYKIYGGNHVRSYKFTAGVISKLCILLIPMVTALVGVGLHINMAWLANWAIGALILAQFYSILNNVYSIHVGREVEEFDSVSWVLKKMKATIERILIQSSSPTIEIREALLKDDDK